MEKKKIWLTWEKQIRNKSMSNALGIPLFEILTKKKGIIRYVSCATKTIAVITRERPSVIICQNPSLALALLLINLKLFFRFKVGIDAHFAAIDADHNPKIPQGILDWCNRSADLVIVTNSNHAGHVRSLGGKAFICPDPLPDLSRFKNKSNEIFKKVLLICSFDVDEPFREVFKAAAMLKEDGFCFFISGRYQKAGISPGDFPQVELLGFVPEDDFYLHLFSSQLVIDLTDNDDCLVCGAYEALEAGKPLILSRKKALQEYFTDGAVFTENHAQGIAAAVRVAYAQRERLAEESRRWVLRTKEDMRKRMIELNDVLGSI